MGFTIPISAIFLVAKTFVQNPLVARWVENMTQGTATKVDDAIWGIVKAIAGVKTDEAIATVEAELRKTQEWFDSLTAEERVEVKRSRPSEFAALFPGDAGAHEVELKA